MLRSSSESYADWLTALRRSWCGGRALASAALVFVLGVTAFSSPVRSQERASTLMLDTFAFTHQPAREALTLIEPLLSLQGTVSIDRQQNMLVLRDHADIVEAVRPLLTDFDHPPRWLRFEVHVLEAERIVAVENEEGRESASPAGAIGAGARDLPVVRVGSQGVGIGGPVREARPIPEELRRSLGGLLAFGRYKLLDQAVIVAREGQTVERTLGGYSVSFDVGTALLDRRLRLRSLELGEADAQGGRPLFHSDINLHSTKPLLVTVSADAQSNKGLVLAVRWLDSPRVSPPVQAR